jgi:hypothetical protein
MGETRPRPKSAKVGQPGTHGQGRLCWLSRGGQSPIPRACVYQPASPYVFELTNRVKASFTPVGSCADSPGPPLRPSPATGHAAEILDVYDPYLGYDAEKFPYKPPQWKMRLTSRAGLLGRLCGNISIYSIVSARQAMRHER